jgi:hypothetical protein
MTGEFTAYCNQYYQLTTQLDADDEHFKTLLANAPPYTGQSYLTDLDDIISYNRTVHAAKAKVDKTYKEWKETAQTILKIMEYFEIPPRTWLTGIIPGELEYEIWANEKGDVFGTVN